MFNATAASGVGGAGVNYGTQQLRRSLSPRTARTPSSNSTSGPRSSSALSGRVKLGIMFDVYNVFNAHPELNIRATTGTLTISESAAVIPTFGTPVTILPPRIARISARLEF